MIPIAVIIVNAPYFKYSGYITADKPVNTKIAIYTRINQKFN